MDRKTSLLVNRQVPEFVREEHPKFILFLEAYYEFLDQQGYGKGKDLRYLSDVDFSLDEFEQQFFNSFMPFIPRDAALNKETLIKNILPLYLSKGSERSYKLLFRMLFDEEVNVEIPGEQILRASDGRWTQENLLKVETGVYSQYVSDGVKTTYYLPYVMDQSNVSVYVNGVLVTNYSFRREYRKIIFNTAPASSAIVKIQYGAFDPLFLKGGRIIGSSSDAEAIIEKANKSNVGSSTFFQLFINSKTKKGNFLNGELITTSLTVDEQLIPLTLEVFFDIEVIEIVDGGSSYNIGDPVIIRGEAKIPASAIVDDVITGTISQLTIANGGAGYKVSANISANNFSNTFFNAVVSEIDSTGTKTSNTITYSTDVISDYSSVQIDAANYGFPGAFTENANTRIIDAISYVSINNLGSVANTLILTSLISLDDSPEFLTEVETAYANTKISELGIIGSISVANGGLNYVVGDKLVFTNITSFSGQGANAEVSSVAANGRILTVKVNSGGLSYQKEAQPQITVTSGTGTGAVLSIGEIMGRGVEYLPISEEGTLGQIKSIRILNPGFGYSTLPAVDLSRFGDGNAVAVANSISSYQTLSGKWTKPNGLVSNDFIRLQGRNYYIPYSYVTSSMVEFEKYKKILKSLLHPAGLINYSKYRIFTDIESQVNNNVQVELSLTVAGRVNISNNSNTVIGINTKFIIANTSNVLTVGDSITINNQTRNVVTISGNTSLNVDDVFTTTSNNQTIKINT